MQTTHHSYQEIYGTLDAAEEIANAKLKSIGSCWTSIWQVLYREQTADELEARSTIYKTLPTAQELADKLFEQYLENRS